MVDDPLLHPYGFFRERSRHQFAAWNDHVGVVVDGGSDVDVTHFFAGYSMFYVNLENRYNYTAINYVKINYSTNSNTVDGYRPITGIKLSYEYRLS